MIRAIIILWLGAFALAVAILMRLETGDERPRHGEADGSGGEGERRDVHGEGNVR